MRKDEYNEVAPLEQQKPSGFRILLIASCVKEQIGVSRINERVSTHLLIKNARENFSLALTEK